MCYENKTVLSYTDISVAWGEKEMDYMFFVHLFVYLVCVSFCFFSSSPCHGLAAASAHPGLYMTPRTFPFIFAERKPSKVY